MSSIIGDDMQEEKEKLDFMHRQISEIMEHL